MPSHIERSRWTQNSSSTFLLALSLVLFLGSTTLISACGRDSVAPEDGGGSLTISAESLEFGAIAAQSSQTKSFTIAADADNPGEVRGSVRLAIGSDADFTLTEGAGDFTLVPGESRQISVRFRPTSGGRAAAATVEFGSDWATIACQGFGSAHPYYRFTPTGLSSGDVRTNYSSFADDGVAVDYGTGRSHGASPGWTECNSVATWIFNGNSVSESTVGFTFSVPSGATSVTVEMGLEAESDCVQTLVQIDGEEHRTENLRSCRTFSKTYSLRGGSHTIRIGTDQQGFCGGDLHVRWISFEIGGVLVPPSAWRN